MEHKPDGLRNILTIVRTDDLTSAIESRGQTTNTAGCTLLTLDLHVSAQGMSQIAECWAMTITTKGKITVEGNLLVPIGDEEGVMGGTCD